MTILHPRTIKSFTLRQGRLTLRQEEALTTQWAHYVLPSNACIDWQTVFPKPAPITLEIGFGMGHALLKNALNFPERCFIGIEVFRPGIGALLAELTTQAIDNVRVFYGDAVEILNRCVPDDSLNAVHIFFPDPWPKRRHHKRRLVQTTFVQLIAQKLLPGGKLHLATDWADYATHMLQVLSPLPDWARVDHAQAKEERPLTKYEARGQRLGHDVWDLVFEKRKL
jgi:tRNA (guanine-N7-)-methyltransferase